MPKLSGVVIGAGINFQKCIQSLLYMQDKEEIEIIAVTADTVYADKIFGVPFRSWDNIFASAQWVLLAEDNDQSAALKRLRDRGVPDDCIVPWQALYIPGFTFDKYLALKRSHVSIIANQCWGGVTYHQLCLPFLSPFINMFIKDDDYIRLLKNLRELVREPLVFVREEWEKGLKINYPVYKIGDVELWMNHYSDFDLAKRKFEQRRERINWDNLYVVMYTESPKIAEEFETLPYEKKLCMTNFETDLPSAMYMEISKHPIFKGKGGWMFTVWTAKGHWAFYDPWELLLQGTHERRWVENVHG